MRVSQNFIKTWMGCPLQAKFRYIDKMGDYRQNAKASFGTCIHNALELYNKTADLDKAIETFKDTWANPEKLGVAPTQWPKYTTFGGLMGRGIEILKEYDAKQKWDKRLVVATEHPFIVPFGRHELLGYVDLLELRNTAKGYTAMRVVDYKTNSKQPLDSQLRLDIQFTSYVYATLQPEFWMGFGTETPAIPDGERLYEEWLDLPRRPIWYHLWGNKEFDCGERDDQDFKRLYRALNEIEKAMDKEVYVPNISGETCVYCDFTEPCGVPYKKDEDDDFWF